MSVVVVQHDGDTVVPRLIAEGRWPGSDGVTVFGSCEADGEVLEIEDVGFDDDAVGGINYSDVAYIRSDDTLGVRLKSGSFALDAPRERLLVKELLGEDASAIGAAPWAMVRRRRRTGGGRRAER